MSKVEVKIFGLPSSGTNYLHWMLERNFNVVVAPDEQVGWKHGFFTSDFLAKDIPAIIIAKHPFMWLESMYRMCQRRHGGDRFPWSTFSGWLRGSGHHHYWNARYHHWLNLEIDSPRVVVKYIDLLKYPKEMFGGIASAIGLRSKYEGGFLEKPKCYVGPDRHLKGDPFSSKFVLDGKFMTQYSVADRKFVCEQVDWRLAMRIGCRRDEW